MKQTEGLAVALKQNGLLCCFYCVLATGERRMLIDLIFSSRGASELCFHLLCSTHFSLKTCWTSLLVNKTDLILIPSVSGDILLKACFKNIDVKKWCQINSDSSAGGNVCSAQTS